MKPIEKYNCQDCNYQWGTSYANFDTPSCPICGEHLNVVEVTDRVITDQERLEEIKEDFKWGIKAAGKGQGYTNLHDDDVTWLISTVEELQKEIELHQKQFNDLEKRWSIAEQARNELLREKDRLNDALKGAAEMANISGVRMLEQSEKIRLLREALEFYAYRHNYAFSPIEDNIPKVNLDGGEKARQALGVDSKCPSKN